MPNNEAACGSQQIERAGDEKQVIFLQWPNGSTDKKISGTPDDNISLGASP